MDIQQDKLESLMDQFTAVSRHVHKLDTYYRLNRLDDIDTLLTQVTEIIEEVDMSCRCMDFHTANPTTANPTTANPTTANPTTANPTTANPTILATTRQPDHEIYHAKVNDYVINKNIMKQLMPLYCALWIKYH